MNAYLHGYSDIFFVTVYDICTLQKCISWVDCLQCVSPLLCCMYLIIVVQ